MLRFLAAVAAVAASLSAHASCGAAFCMVNTGFSASGVWTEPGTRLDLRYEYIDQDQPLHGKDKVSVGGRKYALRRLDERGTAEAEVIGIGHPTEGDHNDRQLLVPLVRGGEIVGRESLEMARERHQRAREELLLMARSLTKGDPVIPTIHE